MKNYINSSTRTYTKYFIGLLFLSLVFSSLFAQQASAIVINSANIPTSVQSHATPYWSSSPIADWKNYHCRNPIDGAYYPFAFHSWVAPSGQPQYDVTTSGIAGNSVVINDGVDSVDLAIYYIGNHCSSNMDPNGDDDAPSASSYLQRPTALPGRTYAQRTRMNNISASSGGYTITPLGSTFADIVWSSTFNTGSPNDTDDRYYAKTDSDVNSFPAGYPFRISGLASLPPGRNYVNVVVTARPVSRWWVDDPSSFFVQHQCVNPNREYSTDINGLDTFASGSSGATTGNACSTSGVSAQVIVDVVPTNPPVGTIKADCDANGNVILEITANDPDGGTPGVSVSDPATGRSYAAAGTYNYPGPQDGIDHYVYLTVTDAQGVTGSVSYSDPYNCPIPTVDIQGRVLNVFDPARAGPTGVRVNTACNGGVSLVTTGANGNFTFTVLRGTPFCISVYDNTPPGVVGSYAIPWGPGYPGCGPTAPAPYNYCQATSYTGQTAGNTGGANDRFGLGTYDSGYDLALTYRPAITCDLEPAGSVETGRPYTPSATVRHTGNVNAPPTVSGTVQVTVPNGSGPSNGTYSNAQNGGLAVAITNFNAITISASSTFTPTGTATGSWGTTEWWAITAPSVPCDSTGVVDLSGDKPYPKIYGSDVWAGGAFGVTSCNPGAGSGGIHAWAEQKGTGPGGFAQYGGASAQFSVTSLMSINEFYSVNAREPGGGAPANTYPRTGLTFANSAGGWGGNFGGNGRCLPDYYTQTQDTTLRTTATFPPTPMGATTTYSSPISVPNDSILGLRWRWSTADPAQPGETCINIYEPSDPAWITPQDNYLCTMGNYGLQWSFAGAVVGMNCVQFAEPAEPASTFWTDNYLCWPGNLELTWSHDPATDGATSDANRKCININEPGDPHFWNDNYLCEPASVRSNSYFTSFGNYVPRNTLDGVIGVAGSGEWASQGNNPAPNYIEYRWRSPQDIAQVLLYDRPNLSDRVTNVTVTLYNGTTSLGSRTLTNLDDSGVTPSIADFGSNIANVNRVRVQIGSFTGPNIGFSEVQMRRITGTTPASSGFPSTGRIQYVPSAGDMTINTGVTIPIATQVAVYVDGDVYINGNIQYSDAARSSRSDIPYFALIVRGNIYVDNNVSRLDGLYIAQPTSGGAKGRIYTCAEGMNDLFDANSMYNNCQVQLSINGSLVADQVRFLRTRQSLRNAAYNELPSMGDGTGSNASEVINYTPEMFMGPSPLKTPGDPDGTTIPQRYDAITGLPPTF